MFAPKVTLAAIKGPHAGAPKVGIGFTIYAMAKNISEYVCALSELAITKTRSTANNSVFYILLPKLTESYILPLKCVAQARVKTPTIFVNAGGRQVTTLIQVGDFIIEVDYI